MLRKHVLNEHENVKQVCSQCGQEFATASTLSAHVIKVHVNMNKFKCAMCGARFKDRSGIRKHVQLHGQVNLFKCSICNEEFKMHVQACNHRIKVHNYQGDVLKMDVDALNLLEEKLIVKIDPEPNGYGESRPRTRNAQPFLGVL